MVFRVVAVQQATSMSNRPSPFLKDVPQKRKRKNLFYKGKTFREIMLKKMSLGDHLPNAL